MRCASGLIHTNHGEHRPLNLGRLGGSNPSCSVVKVWVSAKGLGGDWLASCQARGLITQACRGNGLLRSKGVGSALRPSEQLAWFGAASYFATS